MLHSPILNSMTSQQIPSQQIPSSPLSTSSTNGNDIQYHHHPASIISPYPHAHNLYHNIIAAHHAQQVALGGHHQFHQPQVYQEEDIHLHDYQMNPVINHHDLIGIDAAPSTTHEIPQLVRMEKRKRTNYSMGGNKAKIEEAVKYLLELSERARPNVRNVAEKMGIPYNTLRDHFKKAQGLMAPPRRTVFDYPMAEYKGPDGTSEHESVRQPEAETPTFNPYDARRRGRKPALPRLIEYQLKAFIREMGALGLVVDRTQLKQVAYKIASDLQLVEFKATDMWLQAFQARHGLSVAHSGGSKKKGWRLPDVPVYGSSSYSQWKLAQSKSLDIDYPAVTDSLTFLGPDPAASYQQTESLRNFDNSKVDEAQKSFLPHTLTPRQPEVEYPYPTSENPPLTDGHSPPMMAVPTFSPRYPLHLSDEELRVRSIASFRSVLQEIQSLIMADNSLAASPPKDKNSLDLVRRVLPSIELCTAHGTGVPDEVVSDPFFGRHDETSFQQSDTGDDETNKRQRLLSLSAFQSQMEEPQQSTTNAGGIMLPEDEHNITASALVAAQVLYRSSPTPRAPHYPHTISTYPSFKTNPVFGSLSTSVDRRRMMTINPDGALPNTNNEPAIIATKIQNPRSVFYTNQPTHDSLANFRRPVENNKIQATPTISKSGRLNPDEYDMAMI